MNETVFRNKLTSGLKDLGCIIIPYVVSIRTYRHVPDLNIISPDFHIWVEVKGPLTELRTGQLNKIEEINSVRKRTAFICRAERKDSPYKWSVTYLSRRKEECKTWKGKNFEELYCLFRDESSGRGRV